MSTTQERLSAEEFLKLPPQRQPCELVRGAVVTMNVPGFRHGWFCNRISYLLTAFVEKHNLGSVATNDAGVVTQRNPDTVRGADVAFYSIERLPPGEMPRGYPAASPDLAVEVLSPDDRWKNVLAKVSEYLNCGVQVVCVVDPESQTVRVYHPDQPEQLLSVEDDLALDVLPGFKLPLAELFTGR